MTDTIDATTAALDDPVLSDAAGAPLMAPPVVASPSPAMPPPPPGSALAPPVLPAPAPVQAAPAAPVPEPAETPAATPELTTGPSAIFSADATVIQLEPAVPILPTNTPVMPSPSTASQTASTFDVEEFLGAPTPSRKAPPKRKGRWLARLVLVALLAAGGWAAQEYGPGLYEEYRGDAEEAGPAEVEAPLAFPNVAASTAPIRTAEFILVGLPETPGATYRVTTDFETSVSQVDITRDSGPDLQILTYGNDAMIRRADGEQWYLLDRGQFPLDGRLERSDWVRRLDELLPAPIRDRATIDASTESTVTDVPTRHLTITVDPALLDGAVADDPASADGAGVTDPTPLDGAVAGDEAPLAETTPDTLGDAAEAVAASPDQQTEGAVAAPGSTPGTVPGAIEIEIWVDGDGLIRQVSGAPQLGAEVITVVRTNAEAWIPEYPEPSEIATLTASALVDLGL